ncbi:DUF3892 domain-containing protein [Rubrobacter tropicus]|uniref:DUF3892 domain-containing protein n=1 Tax=Rubrobacter tropicus TaxID=2653851 RepID=A0A6G8Q5H6_9ACTN|nr:DUF3892 domain-containing protein [Rubrobacter tropicus]QIN81577.1 DUF3892 domain-containing protein [Rubrobacter tropicus]
MAKRKVTDARQDRDGNISHVKLKGNQNFTPVERAIEMAKRGGLENAHAVKKKDGGEYLRTNPDGKAGNNLDEMAQD